MTLMSPVSETTAHVGYSFGYRKPRCPAPSNWSISSRTVTTVTHTRVPTPSSAEVEEGSRNRELPRSGEGEKGKESEGRAQQADVTQEVAPLRPALRRVGARPERVKQQCGRDQEGRDHQHADVRPDPQHHRDGGDDLPDTDGPAGHIGNRHLPFSQGHIPLMVDDITPRRNDEHRHKEDATEEEDHAGRGAHRGQRPPPAAKRRAWASSNMVSS